MTRPQVDVGIVSWNTRDLTLRAVRSLHDRDWGCDVRVLVRDHASTDGTADALAGLDVELDRHHANPGFAAGVNALVARSKAPWFLAMNSDAVPQPGALATLVAALEQEPRAGAVSAALRRPDGTEEPAALPFPTLRAALAGLLRPRAPEQPRRRTSVDWVVGAAVLFRRTALDDVGPLEESFHMYAEDLEWCWRARHRGWEVLLEPAAVVVHVGNASGAQAYGRHRSAAVAASTEAFLRVTRGPAVAAGYRALVAAAAGRQWLSARRHRDAGRTAYWQRELAAQLRPRRRP